MPGIAHARSCEIRHRGTDATGDHVAFDLGGPQFDLVEPGGVRWGEVPMHPRILGEECIDPPGLMRREVISDHANLFAVGLVGHEIGQEGDKLGRGVAGSGLAQHRARFGVERGVQREGPVTDVLNAMAFGPPRRQRSHWVFAIERLNRGVLVHAEHGRVLRRMQRQADHIGRLGLEVRIVGGQVPFQPMGPQGVLGPDARHRHVGEAPQRRRQLARGPRRRSVAREVVRRPGQDVCLEPIGHCVAGEQSRQPIRGTALAPPTDGTVIAVQLGANLGPRQAIGHQQNQTGAPSRIGSTVTGSRLTLKFHAFTPSQCHHVLHRRQDTTILSADNQGLIMFKERWSAVSSPLTTWRAPIGTVSSSFEHIKVRLAKEMCSHLPDSLLALAGRLLYRHIG